nr:ABC transporter ATP-binding protein [Wenzhouxiangella sp. XN79A]
MRGLVRRYGEGPRAVRVLDGVDLDVRPGETVAIMGASGCGKSTLLHLAAGMDRPDAGEVRIAGVEVHGRPEPARTRERARRVGLVFQDFNLIESLTARENVELAVWLSGAAVAADRIDALAGELGIGELLERRPDQLSGGQQQRVAIARALIHGPAVLLADEPTGSLDRVAGEQVLDVLFDAARARDCALVLVTHSDQAAARCDRVLALRDGRLVPA